MSSLRADWDLRMAAHPVPPARWFAAMADAGVQYGDRPLCIHRTPIFLVPRELRRWQLRMARFHRIVREARAALLADVGRADGLAASIGIPEQNRAWAAIDPGYTSAAPLARLDCFADRETVQFVELNAEAPAGMGYASALQSLFLRDPAAFDGLRALDPIPHLLACLHGIWRERATRMGTTPRRPSIAIVDLAGGATAADLLLIRAQFRRRGNQTEVVAPEDLEFDGDTLRAGDFRIDLVYRRALVSDLRAAPERYSALLHAYAAGRVCMVNPLRTALLHNKGLFALLHDPAGPVRAADRAYIRRHIPETWVLLDSGGDDIRERVRRDPEHWVLKPLEGHGGVGVVLGWNTPRVEWERRVDSATHHVAQRRVGGPTDTFFDMHTGRFESRRVGLDPFLVRGRLAGFLCRVTEGELGNVTAGGASQVPVLLTG